MLVHPRINLKARFLGLETIIFFFFYKCYLLLLTLCFRGFYHWTKL